MKVIGINSGYDASMNKIHSGGCALVIDGKIIMAIAEDRVSRNKNEGGYHHSLKYILSEENLSVEDIDYFYISFYANPVIPDKSIIKFHLEDLNCENHPEKLVVVPSHHFSHACLAYFLSSFDEAIIMVADNEGSLLTPKESINKNIIFNECERNSYFWARGNCISLIGRDFEHPNSVCFGKAYNKFNEYIGFGSYLNAGKTMGLSSYGCSNNEWEKLDLWYMNEDGNLQSHIVETHDSYSDINYFFRKNNIRLDNNSDFNGEEYKNLAYFIQHQLNKWSLIKLRFLKNKIGMKNICISGGVALNGVMNNFIEENMKSGIFVPPYCSDPGQALGNAIYGYLQQTGSMNNPYIHRRSFENYIYLGANYTNERIQTELESNYSMDSRVNLDFNSDVILFAAKAISEGKIIGFYHGRSEYGARALGNRSILASPSSENIRDRINTLKGRELFRPLAPAVLFEYFEEYFEGKPSLLNDMMLTVTNVSVSKAGKIPGVVHVDGTARVQTVKRDINHHFYNLIDAVHRITGIPIVINTSFNKAGEAIVESPVDAVESFLSMGLDYLICGNCLIKKSLNMLK